MFSFFFNRGKRSKEDLQLIRFLIRTFGHRPQNLLFFQHAVTHKSLSHKSDIISNERLEYLGDAILDAVVADMLFHLYPEENEGYLTKIKSKLVSRKALGTIGEDIGLRDVLRYQQGRTINLLTLEGNAFEAIIGAIYLDGGYSAAKKSIEMHIFKKYVDLNKILEEEIDFKSRLYIWCQKKRLNIEFLVISEKNTGHSWEYEIDVLINEKRYGRGFGNSKKVAEQAASRQTLELMGEI